jgi:hypothetical protein
LFADQALGASETILKHNSTVPAFRRIIRGGGQTRSGAVLFPYKGLYVADIGAYKGYYTLLASLIVGPSRHVYSFEPEENNYKYLGTITRISRLKQVLLRTSTGLFYENSPFRR